MGEMKSPLKTRNRKHPPCSRQQRQQTRCYIKCICVHHNWMMNALNADVGQRIGRYMDVERIWFNFNEAAMQFFNCQTGCNMCGCKGLRFHSTVGQFQFISCIIRQMHDVFSWLTWLRCRFIQISIFYIVVLRKVPTHQRDVWETIALKNDLHHWNSSHNKFSSSH